MSCGCGCNNCGDSKTPKMNGTEVTILSGTDTFKPARKNGGETETGVYTVAISALAIAALAFFVTNK